MRIRCIKNKGNYPELVLPIDRTKPVNNSNFEATVIGITGDVEGNYLLTVGQDYAVFGILTYGGDVRYLIQNCEGIQSFYPSTLFSILDRDISPDWSMNLYTLPDGKLFVVSYDAMTKSYDALLALIREESRAVEDFLGYQQALEEWYH